LAKRAILLNETEIEELVAQLGMQSKERLPLLLNNACDDKAFPDASDFFAGFNAYTQHPYVRDVVEPQLVWQSGSTRLLDYNEADAACELPVVLFIPSLINRSYILDLHSRYSFLRYLAGQGMHPYLIDFGEPLEEELGFGISHYITLRVEEVIKCLTRRCGKKIILAGYCMGGLMAMAAAVRMNSAVQALALLATPWDFHKTSMACLTVDGFRQVLASTIESVHKIPNQAIQALFYMLNPIKVYHKFSAFAKMDPASEEAELFVSVERWVNDGISVPTPVAQECLTEWIVSNAPLKRLWQVAGTIIDPAVLSLPTLIVIPENDYIVPPASTESLLSLLPHTTLIRPSSGHVGMVIGHQAEKELWQPFGEWVRCVV
jgi:polyhydroxyalkanoate synthase subunit PhaC